MGCALLVTRACFEAVGGFSDEIAVYYEDVDFCLAAREGGYGAVVEPRAVVQHDGLRGFASGLTPWAAYLAMVGASAALYLLRGRGDVVRALGRGVRSGVRIAAGAPPEPVGAPGARG